MKYLRIQQIIRQHQELLQEHYSTDFDEIDVEIISNFIESIQKSGSCIYRSYERDQVRSIYRFWVDYIYRYEKSMGYPALYPAQDIFPYAGVLVRPRVAFSWLGVILVLVILFAILSFKISQSNLKQLKETGLPGNQENSLVSTLISASTQTASQIDHNDLIQLKTATPSPQDLPGKTISTVTATPSTPIQDDSR